METCKTCIFWFIGKQKVEESKTGYCRRYPPQMLVKTIPVDKTGAPIQSAMQQPVAMGQQIEGHFPMMAATGLCGEWKPVSLQ